MVPIPLIANILDQAGNQLGGFLPRLLGALVLLVIGVLLARLLARLLGKVLERAGIDSKAEQWGVHDALDRAGLGRSLTRTLVAAIRIGLTLVVIFAALSLLGLEFLSESLNAAVLFLPKLLIAAALLLAGVVLGGLVRERVDGLTDQMDLPVPLGLFAQVTVVSVFAITAAAQIAVSSAILLVLVAIVLAGAVGTFALAFGLGGRDIARSLNAGRIISGSFELGQLIEAGEMKGEIIAFEPSVTVLRTDRGSLRVPNHLLVNEPVLVASEPDPPVAEPSSDPSG